MYIKVTVTAGVNKEKFVEKKKGYFDAWVKEEAERNMANTRIIELVAEHYKIPKNKVRIINGHTHRSKLLTIDIEGE